VKEAQPPRGWKKLHDLAQSETDSKNLAGIVMRLNFMLSRQEMKKGSNRRRQPAVKSVRPLALCSSGWRGHSGMV
jgi:hypothetical protein